MHTEAVNHAPAISFFLTGAEMPGRPSMGAWLTYGLGSENARSAGLRRDDLARQGSRRAGRSSTTSTGAAGFCRRSYQGVKFRGSGDPVLYLSESGRHERATCGAGCSTTSPS